MDAAEDWVEDYSVDEMKADFELEEQELAKFVKTSARVKNKITVPWAVRIRIVRAIVLIHHQARYFEGMSILSALAGWKPRILENEFDSPAERKRTREHFNNWVRSLTRG